MDLKRWDDVVARHPAGAILDRLFPVLPPGAVAPSRLAPTGLKRDDYLPLIAGNVDFWKAHQDIRGAIIDPYEKAERQYATPAFALAGATLVAVSDRGDLRDIVTRALTFSIDALANHTTANNHADFYIPMVMHARRLMQERAPKETLALWDRQLESLVPEEAYRDHDGGANWNIVNLAGECLRRKDGLVAKKQRDKQAAYLERCFERQERRYTKLGMYEDPNAPLAYDAFPRLWLDDMLADGAYDGPHRARLEEFLVLGGLSTLLLLSPSGEWACGGRSAHHQWNEAEVAVICEVNAGRWKAADRPDTAGAFKRAAHLSLISMRRWQRPSGELWIVKNRADPANRHGYEGYSFHSQYNLLAVAMLAIAHGRADDAIEERPVPSETGGYVFDAREPFHKVCAATAGTYVLLDTAADPHYNATGLLRVHRAGVPISPFSDNAAPHRAYGPPGEKALRGMTPGIAWKMAENGEWQSLADFHHASFTSGVGPGVVGSAELTVHEETPQRTAFSVRYDLKGADARTVAIVEEDYALTAEGVEGAARLTGDNPPAQTRVLFPLLVSDGAADTMVTLEGAQARIAMNGAQLAWEVLTPPGVTLALDGERVPTHNGWMQAASGDLPEGTREVRWRLRLASG